MDITEILIKIERIKEQDPVTAWYDLKMLGAAIKQNMGDCYELMDAEERSGINSQLWRDSASLP